MVAEQNSREGAGRKGSERTNPRQRQPPTPVCISGQPRTSPSTSALQSSHLRAEVLDRGLPSSTGESPGPCDSQVKSQRASGLQVHKGGPSRHRACRVGGLKEEQSSHLAHLSHREATVATKELENRLPSQRAGCVSQPTAQFFLGLEFRGTPSNSRVPGACFNSCTRTIHDPHLRVFWFRGGEHPAMGTAGSATLRDPGMTGRRLRGES